jgi:16S rRNA (cytosine1402-N4)-methyltransferase
MSEPAHTPVMAAEVLAALDPRDGGIYVDGTFGRGGYSEAILAAAATTVFGIDRDPAAVTFGAELGRRYAGRLTVLQGRFGDMRQLMRSAGIDRVDGVALDLGVSSPQIDDPARGFSFRAEGPLDMRMGTDGESAADFVNNADEEELSRVIRELGEEKQARRVARAIVAARAAKPFLTTTDLADLVRSVVRKSGDLDPATRTFMAIRIHVNDELGELRRGLEGAELLLKPGGRLAVVSFHSLEDRIVKSFLTERCGRTARGSRHLPEVVDARRPTFRLVHKGALKPSDREAGANPRARSARLRAAERTDAPAWPSAVAQAG